MFITKKSLTFFCVTLVLTVVTAQLWAFSSVPSKQTATPGKVLVRFFDGVDPDRIAHIIESENGTVKSFLASTGVYIILLPEDADASDARERLSSYPEVQYVELVQKASPLEEK